MSLKRMPLWYTQECQEANTFGVDLRTAGRFPGSAQSRVTFTSSEASDNAAESPEVIWDELPDN